MNHSVARIKSGFDMVAYATTHLGGHAETVSRGEVKIAGGGHGGLFIKTDDGQWYHHDQSRGGDALDLVGYFRFGDSWNPRDAEQFKAALNEAAAFAGMSDEIDVPNIPGYAHVARYDYTSGDGTLLYYKHRFESTEAPVAKRFLCQLPNGQLSLGTQQPVLYMLADLTRGIVEQQTVFVVEGEKVADLLRDRGLVVTSHPFGAKERWDTSFLDVLGKAHELILLPDNDAPGKRHMDALARALHGTVATIKVIDLPGLGPKGDAADYIGSGGTMQELLRICSESPEYIPTSPAPPDDATTTPEPKNNLELFRDEIAKTLSKKLDRKKKQKLSERVAQWFIDEDRLLRDTSSAGSTIPYAICLNGGVVPLTKQPHQSIRLTLHYLGFNATEATFKWVYEHVVNEASIRGRIVALASWTHVHGNRLYVSSGIDKLVVGEMIDGEPVLTIQQNGYDGVLFPATSCYPAWEPTDPVEPSNVRALTPFLEAPPEAPEYGPAIQLHLFYSWLVAQMLGISPRPLLTHIGSKEGGKSLMAREVTRLWSGASANVAQIPNSLRDFLACATNLPCYCIDNLDAAPDKWMLDCLATAATGGQQLERALFSNSELHSRSVNASVIITTRTALFAKRPDIRDRVLPLFFRSIEDLEKVDDKQLAREVQASRHGVLSWLMTRGLEVISSRRIAQGLPSRFQEFALVVTQADLGFGTKCLVALEKAQGLSVSDNDELLEAILNYSGSFPISGTATQIITLLQETSGDLAYQGGGKVISRKLKEMKEGLGLAGYSLTWEPRNNTTYFSISQLPEGSASQILEP